MKKYLIISLFLLTLPQHSNAYSLKEALEKAYTNNPELLKERQKQIAANEQYFEAFSGFLPKVDASYSIERERRKVNDGSRSYISPEVKALSVSQPVFRSGGTISDVSAANAKVKSDIYKLKQAESDVLLKTAKAYIDVFSTREIRQLSENNTLVLQQHLYATEKRLESGSANKTDVAQAKSRLAIAESEEIEAKGNLDIANARFKQILAELPPEDISLEYEKKKPTPKTLQDSVTIARKQNPLLLEKKFLEKSARSEELSTKTEFLPKVDLHGQVIRGSDSRFGDTSSDFDTESVKLTATIPLYNSGMNYSNVRKAKRNFNAAKFDFIDTQNVVEQEVTATWTDLKTTKSNIKARKSSMDAALIAMDSIAKEYQYGTRTLLDLLDQEQELFEARVELIKARSDYILAYFEFKKALGEMNAEGLKLNVELFDPEKEFKKGKYRVIGF